MSMSKVFGICLVGAFLLTGVIFLSSDGRAACGLCGYPENPSGIYGVVSNSSGNPVANAMVYAICTAGCGTAKDSCMTNTSGQYSIFIGTCPDQPAGGFYDVFAVRLAPAPPCATDTTNIRWCDGVAPCTVEHNMTCN